MLDQMQSTDKNYENHQKLYKSAGKNIHEIQRSTKYVVLSAQRQHREGLITRKRLKLESFVETNVKLSSRAEKEQVDTLLQMLKSGQRHEALTCLHRSFARNPENSVTFISHEGLPLLQSCLLSSDSSLLHAAAWCAVNLTAADSQTLAKSFARLSPLLVQFLQSSDTVMQELCAWALGNIAGDSQSSRETLLHQGVIPLLLQLLNTSHQIQQEARTQSVLFALINLAQDNDFSCIRCMQENSLFSCVQRLITEVPESSPICLEVAWLICCVYSRRETFQEYRDQYAAILHSLVMKINSSELENSLSKEQIIIPYLICCGNIVGLSTKMAVQASDLPMFLPVIALCLRCDSQSVVSLTLWVLINFTGEPSCRILVMCQPELLANILSLCAHQNSEIVSQVLFLLEAMSRVSSKMNQRWVKGETVQHISGLLTHYNPCIVRRTLVLMEALLQCESSQVHSTDTILYVRKSLEMLIATSFDGELVNQARLVLDLL